MDVGNRIGTDVDRGVPIPAVAHWLEAQLGHTLGPLVVTPIAGGRSNLTYELSDGSGRRWALRRPPLGQVLPTAHDVSREFRILHALANTAVPVPKLIGLCNDLEVAHAPFFVMEFVDGRVLRTAGDVERLTPLARRRAGVDLAINLAHIHNVDYRECGLDGLGREKNYVHRQLSRWQRQYAETKTHSLAEVDEAYEALSAQIPEQAGAALVHGDYRLDNVIVAPDGQVRSVLDWELCTLGDPLADVGQMILRTECESSGTGQVDTRPLLAANGYPRTDEILHAYSATRGIEVADVGYYVALAAWKSACILQGVYARQLRGVMGGGHYEDPELLTVIRGRAREALRRLEALSTT